MQPRPPFDLELLVVIILGIVLILGLGWIFIPKDSSESPPPPTPEPTATLSEVIIGVTRSPRPSSSVTPSPEEATPSATETSPVAYPGPLEETLPPVSTLVTGSEAVPSEDSGPDQSQPLVVGKHDDTNPNIVYDRFWSFKMNSGTKFAYKGTLHISNSIGSEFSFRFTGRQIILGYQRGRSFGTVRVTIDDQTYSFHEEAFGNVWRSPELPEGTHSVRLLHDSGESVNLDSIEVRP